MKSSTIFFPIVVAVVVSCFCVSSVEGELWLRFTFNNDDIPNYEVVDDEGIGGFYGVTHRDGLPTSLTYVDAPGDQAIQFTQGNNDYILFTKDNPGGIDYHSLPSEIVDGGMSIAYWLRFDITADGYQSLLTTGTSNPPHDHIQHSLRYPSGGSGPYSQRRFQNPYMVPSQNETLINSGQWHHLAWTVEGVAPSQTQKFYVDGQLKHTDVNRTIGIGGSFSRFGITSYSGWKEPFSGELDQLDIYDHAINGAKVLDLYNEGALSDGNRVGKPSFNPPGGFYGEEQTVTISSSTSGATIYYTNDGSDPTTGSLLYTSPILVDADVTLKAIGTKIDFQTSTTATAQYILQTATPTFNPPGGIFDEGPTVSISCVTSGSTIYYTTDGSNPTTGSAVYSAPIFISSGDVMLKAMATKSGFQDSAIASEQYYVQVDTCTFDPPGGLYDGVTVSISCATSGASIYYTTNGAEPTTSSSLYSSPIYLENDTTLKAIGVKGGMNNSFTATAVYSMITSVDFEVNRPRAWRKDNRIFWPETEQFNDEQFFYKTYKADFVGDDTLKAFNLSVGGNKRPLVRSLSITSEGNVVNPKVLTDSEDCVDSDTPATIAADVCRAGMSDKQKALAIWYYLAEATYYRANHIEYLPGQPTYGCTPGAVINSAGYAECSHLAPLPIPYWLAAGLPDAKKMRMGPDCGTIFHSTSEVYYDGDWHEMDLTQLNFYLENDNQTIAGISELVADNSLVFRMTNSTGYDPTVTEPGYISNKYGCEFPGGTTGLPGSSYGSFMYPPIHTLAMTMGPGQSFTRMKSSEGFYWQAWETTDPYTIALENANRKKSFGEYIANGILNYPLEPGESSFGGLVPQAFAFFEDDFSQYELFASRWPIASVTVGCLQLDAGDPTSEYRNLVLTMTDEMQSKVMDLSVMTSVELKYSWKRKGTESGDDLYIDYWDGGSWQRLATHYYNDGAENVYYQASEFLPAGALHAGFRLRLQSSCDEVFNDQWLLDDMSLVDHGGGRRGLTFDSQATPPCRTTAQGQSGYFILPIESPICITDLRVDADFYRPSSGDSITVSYYSDDTESYSTLFTVSGTGDSVVVSEEVPILRGQYKMLVKFTFNSSTGTPCGLNSATVRVRLQNNPRVIPPLELGDNVISYSSDSQSGDVNVSYIYVEREELPIAVQWGNLQPCNLDAVFFCDKSSQTSIPITLVNNGGTAVTITPTVSHTPAGWTMSFTSGSVVLAPGGEGSLSLNCTPAPGSSEGAVGAELNFSSATYGDARKRLLLAAVDSFVAVQAENGILSGMSAIDYDGATGKCIAPNAGQAGVGTATYQVNVPQSGNYYLVTRRNPTKIKYNGNIIKFVVGGTTRYINRFNANNVYHHKLDHLIDQWEWVRNSDAIYLSAGVHQVVITSLKQDVYVDSFVLVNNGDVADQVLMNQLYCPEGFDEAVAKKLLPGDLDGSSDLGSVDLAEFAGQWLDEERPFQETSGLVVMEAEHYVSRQNGYRWSLAGLVSWDTLAGESSLGDGFVRALPDAFLSIDNDIELISPCLSYEVDFSTAGTYYLWFKGKAADGSCDSIHYGLDGAVAIGSNGGEISVGSNFAWRSMDRNNSRPTINIPAPGVYSIDIWMREDGAKLDRVALSNNGSYDPSVSEPPESSYFQMSQRKADLNFDGIIDLNDFGIFSGFWLEDAN